MLIPSLKELERAEIISLSDSTQIGLYTTYVVREPERGVERRAAIPIEKSQTRDGLNPFPAMVLDYLESKTSGMPSCCGPYTDGPCLWAPFTGQTPLGGGTRCPLEVPRPPLGRFDDPPERWPLP
jgi:hypothetical protein